MEQDAKLEKYLEDRANFWISVSESGDQARMKEAIEKIDKEMNPEIDRLSIEVKELLEEYNENK
jgi:hypothetical protein